MNPTQHRRLRISTGVAALMLYTYALVSLIAYSFRNPHLTDTERFLRIWEALTWQ